MFYEYQRKLSEKMLFKKIKRNPGYVGLWTTGTRSETLWRSVALDVARLKQKHNYREKNIRPISLKLLGHGTGGLRIAVGATFPLETARRRHETPLGNKTTAILLSVAPLPALPSPPITGIFGRLAIFVFLKYQNQKTIFISDFISIDTVSRSFVTHE